jgi:hypothetical protein
MVKKLAIFGAGMLFLAGVMAGQPNQTANRKKQQAETASVAMRIQKSPPDHQSQAYPDPPKWYAPLKRPEWWLVAAAFLTLYAVCRQVRESANATKAMRDSIRLQEAKMVVTINKERPYVVVTAEMVGKDEFIFRAANKGNTPARIMSVWYCPVVTKRGGSVVIPPDEKTAESLISHPPLLLPPDGTFFVFRWGVTEMKGISLPPIASLHFYGRIRYSNTLESNQAAAYETRWLYWAVPIDDRPPIPDPRHPEHNTWT